MSSVKVDKESSNKPSAEDLLSGCDFDRDFLINKSIQLHIKELEKGTVSYGDGNLKEKAKSILELGANQILEGREPSKDFLLFVATSIKKVIDGDQITLDHAFGLTQKQARPRKDPQDDDLTVSSFLCAMELMSDKPDKESLLEALNAAYTARYGESMADQHAKNWDKKSIGDRMTGVKRVLRKRGVLL